MKDFFKEISDNKSVPTYKMFIEGKWQFSSGDRTNDIVSPIDGKVVGYINVATSDEINRAILSAKNAQSAWANASLNTRITAMMLVADYLREYADELGKILTVEIGKPVDEASKEYIRSAEMIDAFVGEVRSLRGEEIPSDQFPGVQPGKTAIVKRVPRGVILAIAPFNYPINLAVSKLAPALLTGNTVVFKPPTYGSISGTYLTKIFVESGLPEGVIQLVTGSGSQIGTKITSNTDISMVAFTGSSQAGETICNNSGMADCLFECGGNNPLIVLSDANLDLTTEHISKGAFSYSGQRCTGVKKIYGLRATLDKVIPRVVEYTKTNMKLGDPMKKGINIGPVITEKAAHTIMRRINDAVKEGAELVYGGNADGSYIEPTILRNVTEKMEVAHMETFGPVVSFIEVDDIDDAIDMINASKYGLQASIFTEDEGTGIALADKINTGTVQINSNPQRGPDHFPFMGVRSSGIGVQGIRYSLEAMTRLKSIVLNSPQ